MTLCITLNTKYVSSTDETFDFDLKKWGMSHHAVPPSRNQRGQRESHYHTPGPWVLHVLSSLK